MSLTERIYDALPSNCRHCDRMMLSSGRCPNCWKHQDYPPEEYD